MAGVRNLENFVLADYKDLKDSDVKGNCRPGHTLSSRQCHLNWPEFPCYYRENCYATDSPGNPDGPFFYPGTEGVLYALGEAFIYLAKQVKYLPETGSDAERLKREEKISRFITSGGLTRTLLGQLGMKVPVIPSSLEGCKKQLVGEGDILPKDFNIDLSKITGIPALPKFTKSKVEKKVKKAVEERFALLEKEIRKDYLDEETMEFLDNAINTYVSGAEVSEEPKAFPNAPAKSAKKTKVKGTLFGGSLNNYNVIVHPLTGKKVSIFSKSGKKLLNEFISYSQ